jgi:hypothetical protein
VSVLFHIPYPIEMVSFDASSYHDLFAEYLKWTQKQGWFLRSSANFKTNSKGFVPCSSLKQNRFWRVCPWHWFVSGTRHRLSWLRFRLYFHGLSRQMMKQRLKFSAWLPSLLCFKIHHLRHLVIWGCRVDGAIGARLFWAITVIPGNRALNPSYNPTRN